MKRCLILTGGKLSLAFAGSFLKEHKFEKVVAVDGGLEAAKELDIIPDVIVGDFDTVHPEILAYYRKMEHIVWEVHQPEKDDTDTELAIKRALAMNCSHITLLGATGGRLDHMIGNIHLLFPCLQKGTYAEIVDSPEPSVSDRRGAYLPKRDADLGEIYFFPASYRRSKGITLKGFKYPLTDRDISIGTSLCISNELVEEEGTITFFRWCY